MTNQWLSLPMRINTATHRRTVFALLVAFSLGTGLGCRDKAKPTSEESLKKEADIQRQMNERERGVRPK